MGVVKVELMNEESPKVRFPMKDDWVLLAIWKVGTI